MKPITPATTLPPSATYHSPVNTKHSVYIANSIADRVATKKNIPMKMLITCFIYVSLIGYKE